MIGWQEIKRTIGDVMLQANFYVAPIRINLQ